MILRDEIKVGDLVKFESRFYVVLSLGGDAVEVSRFSQDGYWAPANMFTRIPEGTVEYVLNYPDLIKEAKEIK